MGCAESPKTGDRLPEVPPDRAETGQNLSGGAPLAVSPLCAPLEKRNGGDRPPAGRGSGRRRIRAGVSFRVNPEPGRGPNADTCSTTDPLT